MIPAALHVSNLLGRRTEQNDKAALQALTIRKSVCKHKDYEKVLAKEFLWKSSKEF